MEMGLLHDYYGNFSMRGEIYCFPVEGSTQGEILVFHDSISDRSVRFLSGFLLLTVACVND